jgi:hypothetical protein
MSMPKQEGVAQASGVSDLAFDLLTLLQNKLQAIAAIEVYKQDARAADYHHVLDFLERCQETDRRAVEELRAMVAHQLVVGLEDQHGFPLESDEALKQRPARRPDDSDVTEASIESFPASDPPSFTTGSRHITQSSS